MVGVVFLKGLGDNICGVVCSRCGCGRSGVERRGFVAWACIPRDRDIMEAIPGMCGGGGVATMEGVCAAGWCHVESTWCRVAITRCITIVLGKSVWGLCGVWLLHQEVFDSNACCAWESVVWWVGDEGGGGVLAMFS